MAKKKTCPTPKAKRKFDKKTFTKKKSTKSKAEARKTAAAAKAQGKRVRTIRNACGVHTVYVK